MRHQDYAGGTAVHINAGVAALVLVLLLGKRMGWPQEQMRPHNLTLTMLGAGMLWLGWYGFNVGSIVFTGATKDENIAQFFSETGRTFANTTLATFAAILGWLLIERLLHARPPRWVRRRASWPAWWPSPRPPVRSTSVEQPRSG